MKRRNKRDAIEEALRQADKTTFALENFRTFEKAIDGFTADPEKRLVMRLGVAALMAEGADDPSLLAVVAHEQLGRLVRVRRKARRKKGAP